MNTREKGRQGENVACDYLQNNGYSIIVKNYYTKHGEIDIIAEDSQYIIFVEVKSRADTKALLKYGRPANAVNKLKREHILYAVKTYLLKFKPTKKPRIDIMELYTSTTDLDYTAIQIKHYKNVFGA